jgi:hypothetical protein
MAYNIKPKDVKTILEMHDRYWDDKQREMWQYKSAYETDFWDKKD